MDTNINPRDRLRGAVATKSLVVADIQTGERALAKAREIVADLDAETHEFPDLDAEIAAERSAAIRRSIDNGSRPDLAPSPRLREALGRHVDVRNQLTAARSAVKQIEKEIAEAKDRENENVRERIWSAEAVLAAEAHDRAKEFIARLDDLRREFYILRQIAVLTVPLDPKDRSPAYIGSTRPIAVSPIVAQAARQRGVLGDFEEISGPRIGTDISSKVMAYFIALRDDPDLEFSIE